MANLLPAMQPDRVRVPTHAIRATPYTPMGLAKVHSDQVAPATSDGMVQRSLASVPDGQAFASACKSSGTTERAGCGGLTGLWSPHGFRRILTTIWAMLRDRTTY
jgi:hypothetical protein